MIQRKVTYSEVPYKHIRVLELCGLKSFVKKSFFTDLKDSRPELDLTLQSLIPIRVSEEKILNRCIDEQRDNFKDFLFSFKARNPKQFPYCTVGP